MEEMHTSDSKVDARMVPNGCDSVGVLRGDLPHCCSTWNTPEAPNGLGWFRPAQLFHVEQSGLGQNGNPADYGDQGEPARPHIRGVPAFSGRPRGFGHQQQPTGCEQRCSVLGRISRGTETSARGHRPRDPRKPTGEIDHISLYRLNPTGQPESSDEANQKIDPFATPIDKVARQLRSGQGHYQTGQPSTGTQVDERRGGIGNQPCQSLRLFDGSAEISWPQHADALGLAQRIDQRFSLDRIEGAHGSVLGQLVVRLRPE